MLPGSDPEPERTKARLERTLQGRSRRAFVHPSFCNRRETLAADAPSLRYAPHGARTKIRKLCLLQFLDPLRMIGDHALQRGNPAFYFPLFLRLGQPLQNLFLSLR